MQAIPVLEMGLPSSQTLSKEREVQGAAFCVCSLSSLLPGITLGRGSRLWTVRPDTVQVTWLFWLLLVLIHVVGVCIPALSRFKARTQASLPCVWMKCLAGPEQKSTLSVLACVDCGHRAPVLGTGSMRPLCHRVGSF